MYTIDTPISVTRENTPIDGRTVIDVANDIPNIELPYEGMIVYARDTRKVYQVLSLKPRQIGPISVDNCAVDEFIELQVPEKAWIGTSTPVVDHIYYHDTYGTVIYLDDDNPMDVVGYQAQPWENIDLYLVSADPSVTGNIVLTTGDNRIVAPVTASVSKVAWCLTDYVSGLVSITRNTEDPEDTLKDGDNIVTALLVDWRAK